MRPSRPDARAMRALAPLAVLASLVAGASAFAPQGPQGPLTTCHTYVGGSTSGQALTGEAFLPVTDDFAVDRVQVAMNVTHPDIDALKVLLRVRREGEKAVVVRLKSNGIGGRGKSMRETTFSDAAQADFPLWANQQPYTGTFAPEVPLSSLAGGSQGEWALLLPTRSKTKAVIDGWRLQLCGSRGFNAASEPANQEPQRGNVIVPSAGGIDALMQQRRERREEARQGAGAQAMAFLGNAGGNLRSAVRPVASLLAYFYYNFFQTYAYVTTNFNIAAIYTGALNRVLTAPRQYLEWKHSLAAGG